MKYARPHPVATQWKKTDRIYAQNEKRKDKLLTERIRKMLKERDEVSKGADICGSERITGVQLLYTEMPVSVKLEQAVDRIVRALQRLYTTMTSLTLRRPSHEDCGPGSLP